MGEEAHGDDIGQTEEDHADGDEWAVGLPSEDELMPLSQPLLSAELVSAFRINLDPCRSVLDVHRASRISFDALRHASSALLSFAEALKPLPSYAPPDSRDGDDAAVMLEDDDPTANEEAAAAAAEEPCDDPSSSRASKRPRLVWTPQLHKRFVDVIEHLGVKKAVPKTIMQLMNVEGLTRENVASHLQKFRQYLKRRHGSPGEDPPGHSDPLFASPPPNRSDLHEQQQQQPPPLVPMASVTVSYALPGMIPMPVYGIAHHHRHGPIGMVPVNSTHQRYPVSGSLFTERH